MVTLRWIVVLALAALTRSGQQVSSQQSLRQAESVPPVSCPVTRRPVHEFIPPAPYKRDDVAFWLGTEKLWACEAERRRSGDYQSSRICAVCYHEIRLEICADRR